MHKPVLLNEVINLLDIQSDDVVLDGTVGGGGYLKAICHRVGKEGIVIGLDQDNSALEKAKSEISSRNYICQTYLLNKNFRNMDKVLDKLKIEKADKIVFDLGFSSDQLENSGRGFSFQKDERLVMTLKDNLTDTDLTAEEIVNNWDEENLADIIFGYGDEKFSRQIAREICEVRKEKKIETTFELVEIIKRAVPKWYQFKKIHCATKTFQALRITVNDEIETLKNGLEKGFEYLNKGGRMAVVSFHSREDKIVKNFFRRKKDEGRGILITKKPATPSVEELRENPCARSAKLRVIEKC
ncbi:MAG: 16S rRNA (cytosine(1402)-N(4))-methyltransferase RsmH [Patescibacteria group bacterium]